MKIRTNSSPTTINPITPPAVVGLACSQAPEMMFVSAAHASIRPSKFRLGAPYIGRGRELLDNGAAAYPDAPAVALKSP